AMDDVLAVGGLHRGADLPEDGEALLERQRVRREVPVERDAVDPLHDVERAAVRGRPDREDLGDRRVRQAELNLPLAAKACEVRLTAEAGPQDLDRDRRPRFALDPGAAIDTTHPALDGYQRIEPVLVGETLTDP